MGARKNPTDIINRAQSNGFKSGLHHEEDKKTGLQDLKASAKSFNGGFKRRTGNSVPAETIAEINSWIGGPLTSEDGSGVTNIERPKYNYKPVRHERERFQFHFLLLLFCDTGARRVGLFEAGIPYKVAQRTVKNNKDPKNRRFGVTGREHRLLRYNAVFFLLHFAIADGALDHNFFTQILNGKGDGSIEWKEAPLELPVCRSVDRNGCLTSEAMTFAVFKHFALITPTDRYTATERSQHVLHNNNRIFGQSYVAFASSCDGLAAFMRETADHTAVEYFQGLHRFHQPGMPVRLPAALLAKVETSAELAAHDNEIRSAVSLDARAKAQRARKNAVKRLRKKTLQEYREECLKTLRKDRLINGCHTANDTLDPLNEVFPEKRRSNDLAVAERLQFWERDVKALDHIDRSHGWHWTCLHCNFVSDSKESGPQTPLSDLLDDCLDESETGASSLASYVGVPLPPEARSEKTPVDPMLLETEVAEGNAISPCSSGPVPLLDASPPSKIALPSADNLMLLGDDDLPDTSSPLPDGQFRVDKLLGKWRYRRKHVYYLRWETGEHSFEPEEDIAEGIRTEFDRRGFTGFHEGAHIIKWTKARNGEAWYLVAFEGTLEKWELPDKALHQDLARPSKPVPKRKAKKGGRRPRR
ncbi:carbonic anhydrase 2 [Beauveria brongniartii RCEF 3172]|uniref:Carbonic anhydrase 2 n=1 Tax=Beauveria brongniartii RCEF 3172 TaxID=1081107 RepID=A0A166VVU9_9HYPO|nr:carbonic anhydrase 2 [Beauveria brongniartii RCEF 3172]